MTKVAVGILTRGGKILACQRRKGGRYELKWEFPGGKVEEGESVEHCLKRELKEELGITVNGMGPIEIQRSHYDDGGLFEVAYCTVTDFTGEPQNKVFEQIRWVTPAELAGLDNLAGNRYIVSKLTQ